MPRSFRAAAALTVLAALVVLAVLVVSIVHGPSFVALLLVPLWHLPRCRSDRSNSEPSLWSVEASHPGPTLQPSTSVESTTAARCGGCRRGTINATAWCATLARLVSRTRSKKETAFFKRLCRSPFVLGPFQWCEDPLANTNASRRAVAQLQAALASSANATASSANVKASSIASSILEHLRKSSRRRDASASCAEEPTAGFAPSLVMAEANWTVGMGNVIGHLSSVAALALALGTGCIVAVGGYVAPLFPLDQLSVFPCISVSLAVAAELRARAKSAGMLLTHDAYERSAYYSKRTLGAPGAAPAVHNVPRAQQQLILHIRPSAHFLRPDVCNGLVPPGMPAALHTRLVRAVLGDMLWAISRHVPVTAEESRVAAASDTLCGHMRQGHAEARVGQALAAGQGASAIASARKLHCMLDCGGVLSAMDALFAANPARHSTFTFSGVLDCTPCLQLLAPRLAARATLLPPPARASAFRTRDGATSSEGDHSNAVAAVADVRLLARCHTLVVDDAAEGSYASFIAGAGGFAHCGSTEEYIAALELHGEEARRHVRPLRGPLSWCTRPPCGTRVLCRRREVADAPFQGCHM